MKTAQPEPLHRVRRFLAETPWAILPSAYELMLEIVGEKLERSAPSSDEIAARIEAARRLPRQAATPGSIQVLPVHGPLFPRANILTDVSGVTSYELLGRDLDAAIADPNVSAIVLDIDSPGGSVSGLEELAEKIHNARGAKPIIAVANQFAASAAYYLASQASELVVSPSAMVGSIGTLFTHVEQSKRLADEGIKVTYVYAGRYKVEGNPVEPLGDEARTEIQRLVDSYYGEFLRAVARGRGVSQATVRERFGEGRMVMAEEAVAIGMADREETLEQTVARLAGRAARNAGARAEVVTPPLAAAGDGPDIAADAPEGHAFVEVLGGEPKLVQVDANAPEISAEEREQLERERLSLQLEKARLARRA